MVAAPTRTYDVPRPTAPEVAPTYDVPRPTAPEMGAVGGPGHFAPDDEDMMWEDLVTSMIAADPELGGGVSNPGYGALPLPSPADSPNPGTSECASGPGDGTLPPPSPDGISTPVMLECTPDVDPAPAANPEPVSEIPEAPAHIYAELGEERGANERSATTDAPAAPPPVPPLRDSGGEPPKPPTEKTKTCVTAIRVGSNSVMAFKLRQLLEKITLAPVRPPVARKSYRGPSGPRLLPCYGRGVSREGVNFCLYCNETFQDVPSLDEHIREAYADIFRCPLCTKGMLRGSAQRHMKKKHSDICDPAKGTLDNTITMLQHKKRKSSL